MMPRQPNKGRHGIMAEGVGLEPTRGLRPAGFRDRSLSQFGAPLHLPKYKRMCSMRGSQTVMRWPRVGTVTLIPRRLRYRASAVHCCSSPCTRQI